MFFGSVTIRHFYNIKESFSNKPIPLCVCVWCVCGVCVVCVVYVWCI